MKFCPLQGNNSIGHSISTDMLPLQGTSNEFQNPKSKITNPKPYITNPKFLNISYSLDRYLIG